MFIFLKTCDIRAEGKKRFLTLKNVQLDQAGEVTYQALNALTSAILTVKGMLIDKQEINDSKMIHFLFFISYLLFITYVHE